MTISPGSLHRRDDPGRTTIARRIAEQLRDAIVTMRLKPGDTISESEIASRFGVSRQPVREAFIQLAEQELLRIRPQRPTEVVRISIRGVLNARFVREALEVATVRLAAINAAGASGRYRRGLPGSMRAAPLVTRPSSALYAFARAKPALRAMA